MKVLKSWLLEYVKTDLSDEELVANLNKTGTEVDAAIFGIDDRVIVAEIKKIEKHPNADRLQLATVFDGNEEIIVVCGASNIQIGQKVPLAQIGAKLPKFTIEKASIRGIESTGMLCAEDELGLGEDHTGIKILPDTYITGEPLKNHIGGDTVLELEITPNRGDCLSHIGIAREIAAFTNQEVKKEPIVLKMTSQTVASELNLTVNNQKSCPQYLARVIKNVKIGPSPKWLKDKIEACGSKSINNVVDVTNYILMDLGQPLHAFDFDKITNKTILVRNAKEGEKITTIDGKERLLTKHNLVIADAEKPIAVAGVMGGLDSEVTDKTVNILLEAAVFERKSIRKTAKELGLTTEASYRYERGIDEAAVEYALNKAAKLIQDTSNGDILSGIVRSGDKNPKESIEVPYDKICRLLGLSLKDDEIKNILKRLGFEKNGIGYLIPSWRHDIEFWQDLAEEVGRIYGYDKVPLFEVPTSKTPKLSQYFSLEHIKDLLVELGGVEVINYAFLSDKDIEAAKLPTAGLLEIANPVQPENKYLRSSLIPCLLKNIAKNPSFDPIFIFEIDHVFTKKNENINLAIAISGKGSNKLAEKSRDQLEKSLKAKGQINFTELSRDELVRFKIKKPSVLTFEVEIASTANKVSQDDRLLDLVKKNHHYRPVSKFPSVTRDIAFIVSQKVNPADMTETIYLASDNINRVELFDEFASEKFGKSKKNVAFHIYLQDLAKTMTDQDADNIVRKIVSSIEPKFSAKLRTE